MLKNCLYSVLESIGVQYENLVSARSTICDADVTKESATYIKAQILQQAFESYMVIRQSNSDW